MDCLFCKIAKKEIDAKILFEDDLIMIIMDAFPNVDGHSLIIPKQHYETFLDIPDDLLIHIHKKAQEWGLILLKKLEKKSLTLLNNYGEAQAIKHYHLHLLPNYGIDKKALHSKDEIAQKLGV
ncbi:MAG: HIT domain-containing protein [Firmicutes bacterium]|nr:HIT domain-containing protein [Bacillota bacterium]